MTIRRDDHPAERDADFDAIADRLRAANERIEAPEGLLERIDADIRAETVERRFRRAGSALAAAAVITLGLTAWWFVGRGGGPSVAPPPDVDPGAPVPVIVAEGPSPVATDAALVRVDFDPESSQFARRVESTNPNVTIHLIYRSVTPLEPADDGAAEPEAMLIDDRGAST
jgi:hypothetical protein